jgi:hypothetical protein
MENINLDDLNDGLVFIFVGKKEHLPHSLERFTNKHNVYFTPEIKLNHHTDKNIDEVALVIGTNDLELKVLDVINFPDPDIDWFTTIKTYEENYNSYEVEESKYKWGQTTTNACEIMCDNCGYITSIKEGETFPICEACQSGLPNSPTEPEKSFWIVL